MKLMGKLICIILVTFILLSCSAQKKKVLYVFNWTDYIAPELIAQFEKDHNCKIEYDTYNSNENMLTKLITSQSAYDIVVPSGDHVSILMKKDLLEPLDVTKLKNFNNLDPVIMQKSQQFDPGNQYSIPYFWGTCGIIYNKKYMPENEMNDISWNIIADQRFSGKKLITMLDDAREVLGVSLITNGFDPNNFSDESLDIAKKTLLTWDKNISQYDSDSFKNEVQDGTIWLGQAYNGDALQVMNENPNVGFALPKEGSTLWIDYLVIPKNSENKELAYQFIDFLISAEAGKENALFVQYATPNKAAFELLPDEIKNNKSIYPSNEYLEKCFLLLNVGEGVLKVDNIWQEIRNN